MVGGDLIKAEGCSLNAALLDVEVFGTMSAYGRDGLQLTDTIIPFFVLGPTVALCHAIGSRNKAVYAQDALSVCPSITSASRLITKRNVTGCTQT